MRVVGGFGNLTDRQISTIEAIVCVVESGRTDKYDAIATMKGDTGGLSYGRHQASLGSGNLHKLVKSYCEARGAAWADELNPFLQKLEEKNVALNTDSEIKKLLRSAAYDPVMVDVQDRFFFDEFMAPALKRWQGLRFQTALSAAVIYDSFIHGNFELIAKRVTVEASPENEKAWVKDYLAKRHMWLSTHSNTLLHATAIRIEALQALAENGNWDLKLPFELKRPSSHYPMTAYDLPGRLYKENDKVIAQRCTPEEFGTIRLRKKSGAVPGNQRDIFIQRALVTAGFLEPGTADGNFGAGTETAIKAFQKKCKLKETGAVGPTDYVKLCEAIDAGGLLGEAEKRPDAGLKPAPEGKGKIVSAGGAGVATAGAVGAGAGAVAMGSGAGEDIPAGQQTQGQQASPTPSVDEAEAAAKGPLCQRTEHFIELPGCTLSKVDTYTVGAIGLFIVAVGLIVVGRRVFDSSNK